MSEKEEVTLNLQQVKDSLIQAGLNERQVIGTILLLNENDRLELPELPEAEKKALEALQEEIVACVMTHVAEKRNPKAESENAAAGISLKNAIETLDKAEEEFEKRRKHHHNLRFASQKEMNDNDKGQHAGNLMRAENQMKDQERIVDQAKKSLENIQAGIALNPEFQTPVERLLSRLK